MGVSTNVTLLNEENAKKLINSGLDVITLSFDALDKKTYERIRKGAKFDVIVKNLKKFLKLNNGKIFTILQMVLMKENKDKIKSFVSSKYKVDMIRVKPYIDLDPDKKYLRIKKKAESKKPCLLLWKWMAITWEGLIVQCCNDYDNIHILGNANKERLIDIWNNQKIRNLRKIHIKGKGKSVSLCKECNGFNINTKLLLISSFICDYNRRRILPIIEREALKKKKSMFKYN